MCNLKGKIYFGNKKFRFGDKESGTFRKKKQVTNSVWMQFFQRDIVFKNREKLV